jgi:hypothetical protein
VASDYYLSKQATRQRVRAAAEKYAETALTDPTLIPRLPHPLKWVVMAILMENEMSIQVALMRACP